jgi:hypothetical protein
MNIVITAAVGDRAARRRGNSKKGEGGAPSDQLQKCQDMTVDSPDSSCRGGDEVRRLFERGNFYLLPKPFNPTQMKALSRHLKGN